MACESGHVNQDQWSSNVSVWGGEGLGRIGLKEKVGFQLLVELTGKSNTSSSPNVLFQIVNGQQITWFLI